MDNFLRTLYTRFLHADITADEFLELKHNVNNTDNNDLRHVVESEWLKNQHGAQMSKDDKEMIKSRLNLYISFEKKKSRKKLMLWVAAIFIPVVAFFSIYQFESNPVIPDKDFQVMVKPGNKAQVKLPDNTVVWLNSNSRLKYSKDDSNKRSVELVGEAFFKVSKDETRPFIVHSGKLSVEVLGTSFNVKADVRKNQIETILVEGKVKLTSDDLYADYYLKPNEKAVFDTEKNSVTISKVEDFNSLSWKDNVFYFKSERFEDVLHRIEDWYGVKVKLGNSALGNEIITGTFRSHDLNTLLEVFSIQFKLKYKLDNDTVYLYR
jgi:transmembrane sensor